ncbi:MAG: hypothetical protein IKO72_13380 [Kiritimatiellae bacterium]|nr:hypothetical protein [Kiritimatiellia bacterium]
MKNVKETLCRICCRTGMLQRRYGMLLVLVAAAASLPVGAAYEDYVKMLTSDNLGTTFSFNTLGKWDDTEGPTAGKKYYVGPSIIISTPNNNDGTVTFAGDELCLAGTLWHLTVQHGVSEVTNLVMLGGSKFHVSAHKSPILGTAYIREAATKPVNMDSSLGILEGVWVTEVGFNFIGDSDQKIALVNASDKVEKPSSVAEFAFTGDMSRYFGTVDIPERTSLAMVGTLNGTVRVAFGGKYRTWFKHGSAESAYYYECFNVYSNAAISRLEVDTGGKIEVSTSNTLTVGTLDLADGVTITAFTNAQVHVTNSISISGVVTLHCPAMKLKESAENVLDNSEIGPPPRYDVFVIASNATGTVTKEMFRPVYALTETDSVFGNLPHLIVEVETKADGTRIVYVTRREIVKLLRTEDAGDKTHSQLNCASNAAGQAYWSDGAAPTPGKDYYVDISSTINIPVTNSPLVFAGSSLTLRSSTGISTGNKANLPKLSFEELYTVGGQTLVYGGTTYPDTYGLISQPIIGGTFWLSSIVSHTLCSYGGKLLRVSSEVRGKGDLYAKTMAASKTGAYGSIELTAINTNWTGSLIVSVNNHSNADRTVPSEKYFTTFIATDGRSLGGPLTKFKPGALTVQQMCQLRVKEDMTLDQTNRGVMAKGMARFAIEQGKTLSIMNPLTMSGLLRKEDAGTLALGGQMLFIDGDAATAPVEGTNTILLANGYLKPLSTNAFDGAAIVVTNGDAGIVFDVEPADEGVKDFGLYDVKWNAPVTLSGQATKLNVSFDKSASPSAPPQERWTLGLFTVATESLADGIMDAIKVTSPYQGYRVVRKKSQNECGSWTISATFARVGTSVILR